MLECEFQWGKSPHCLWKSTRAIFDCRVWL